MYNKTDDDKFTKSKVLRLWQKKKTYRSLT